MQHGFVKGQSMAEYGLVCSLVGISVIGGLIFFGKNLQEGMAKAMPQSGKTVQTSSISLAAPADVQQSVATPQAASAAAPADTTPPATQTAVNTVSSAGQAAMSSGPVSMKNLITTTGANGATGYMADQLTAYSQQLLDAGEISPTQASLLSELANQGHKIAAVEKALEDLATQYAGNPSGFKNAKITIDGKQQSVGVVLDMIGEGDGGKLIPGNESTKLVELLNKVTNSGALANADVKKFVTTMTNQINVLSNEVQMAGWSVMHGSDPAGFNAEVASSMPNVTVASATTNSDSAAICTTGGGKDSKNNCS